MAVWLNLVLDAAPVLGKLLPSLMVLVSFLDPPLCRGFFFFSVAILSDVLSVPTHGTLLLPTTLFVVMIIDLLEDSLGADRSRVLLFSTCPLGINTMCTMSDCVLDSTLSYNRLLGPSQVSNRRLFNNDVFQNKTTSPWAIYHCVSLVSVLLSMMIKQRKDKIKTLSL